MTTTIPPRNPVEPWMRGTLTEVPPVKRAVLHALEMAREDVERWCLPLTDRQLHERPLELAPVAFHIRHIGGACDRLLTYAEGQQLSAEQMDVLKAELAAVTPREALFTKFSRELERAVARVLAFDAAQFNDVREIGRKKLPASVAGILIHISDHTMRHVGQAITTAQIVLRM